MGRRYPLPAFKEWRDKTLSQLLPQWFAQGKPYVVSPSAAAIRYWAGDERKRDVPAMIDGLWHCLEHAGIVADDSLLEDVAWVKMGLDRERPRMEIEICPKK